MGDLSKNFNRSEFACKGTNCCGHSAAVHPDLVDALAHQREHLAQQDDRGAHGISESIYQVTEGGSERP